MDVDDISHEEMAEREEDQRQKPEEGLRRRKEANPTDTARIQKSSFTFFYQAHPLYYTANSTEKPVLATLALLLADLNGLLNLSYIPFPHPFPHPLALCLASLLMTSPIPWKWSAQCCFPNCHFVLLSSISVWTLHLTIPSPANLRTNPIIILFMCEYRACKWSPQVLLVPMSRTDHLKQNQHHAVP